MAFTPRSLQRMTLLATTLALLVGLLPTAAVAQAGNSGFVYVMTNQASGNTVLQFRRFANGSLAQVQEVSTGGLGSGGTLNPLASQDSLVLSGDGRLLLAVNAGSDEVSVLGVGRKGMVLLDVEPSGGDFPNSVAIHGDLVYVLNAHGTPNVTGFRLDHDGTLEAIPGSTRELPGDRAAAPNHVRFSPDGTRLLVTEGGTHQIDVFEIGDDGLIVDVLTQPSAGLVPFSFAFGHGGVVIVAEAGSASASSYRLEGDGTLDVISAAVPNGQAASCWIALTRSGKHAFISNTAAATISSYRVDGNGDLALIEAVAAATGAGSAPIDSALSRNSRFLYVVDSTLGRVLIYRVAGADLVPIGSVTGLPTSLQGIAAQ